MVLEKVDTRTVGLHPVLRELGRNTTVTTLAIRDSVLSHENVQQFKSVLFRNTILQSLDLMSSNLGSERLAEIAPALYRNISIKALDLAHNGLHGTEAANILRKSIRRIKTITSLCLANNTFVRNAAAVRSIADGVRAAALSSGMRTGRPGCFLLTNAFVSRNANTLVLDLHNNRITSVGVRALVDDNVEVVKALTKLCLIYKPIKSEGATSLADAIIWVCCW